MLIKEKVVELNGSKLVFRAAKIEDAEILFKFIKDVSIETNFLARDKMDNQNVTIKDEMLFISSMNDAKRSAMILVFLDDEYVGNCSINELSLYRMRHRANIGMVLYEKFTSRGIGTLLMKELIEVAKSLGYEQLELEVVINNQKAIKLYQKYGFKIYGIIPKYLKYEDGHYADVYLMMLDI